MGSYGMAVEPMFYDEVLRTPHANVYYKITNTGMYANTYNLRVEKLTEYSNDIVYTDATIVGGNSTSFIPVRVNVSKDKLEVFRVCIQEQSQAGANIAVQVCARLRLYWPASHLTPQ